MKKFIIKPIDSPFTSFHVIRQLINKVGYNPGSLYEKESFRILNPINYKFEAENRSLTENQDYKYQLRFFTLERIVRVLDTLLISLHKFFGEKLELIIITENKLDDGSALFLERLVIKGLGKVTYLKSYDCSDEKIADIEIEDYVENLVRDEIIKGDIYNIHDLASKFLSVGDAWTAISLIKYLLINNKNDEYFYDLGIAYTQINQTEIAELYLNKSKELSWERRVVGANYVLSMLYTRHHPLYLQSIDKAEKLLNEAYQFLENKEISYQKIFNRNGYALILFRKGKVYEAIDILINGISSLRSSGLSSKDEKLHESVLTYNLAQCYVSLNMRDQAYKAFEELILMDNYYPENHLEYAKYLLQLEDYDLALEHLLKAKDLNPNLPEVHSLLGLYYLDRHQDSSLASEHYYNAYILSYKNEQFAYDLLYVYTLQEKYRECLTLLDKIELSSVTMKEEEYINFMIIKVECLMNLGYKEEGLATLSQLLESYPTNQMLIENHDLVIGV